MVRRAVTLLELLVVIAIVGVLLGILVPAISRARWASRLACCAANLHAVGQAIHTYETDQGESPMANPMPAPFNWPQPLSPLYEVLAADCRGEVQCIAAPTMVDRCMTAARRRRRASGG